MNFSLTFFPPYIATFLITAKFLHLETFGNNAKSMLPSPIVVYGAKPYGVNGETQGTTLKQKKNEFLFVTQFL